jgi:transposase
MVPEANTNAVLTVKEAAAWFGVVASTVRMWVRTYKIECVGMRDQAKLYRFGALVEADRATRNAPTQPGRKT